MREELTHDSVTMGKISGSLALAVTETEAIELEELTGIFHVHVPLCSGR